MAVSAIAKIVQLDFTVFKILKCAAIVVNCITVINNPPKST